LSRPGRCRCSIERKHRARLDSIDVTIREADGSIPPPSHRRVCELSVPRRRKIGGKVPARGA
jgi:hypothetical protein